VGENCNQERRRFARAGLRAAGGVGAGQCLRQDAAWMGVQYWNSRSAIHADLHGQVQVMEARHARFRRD
jgi:hypothetical protein